jgi:hypothetical protein
MYASNADKQRAYRRRKAALARDAQLTPSERFAVTHTQMLQVLQEMVDRVEEIGATIHQQGQSPSAHGRIAVTSDGVCRHPTSDQTWIDGGIRMCGLCGAEVDE